MSNQDAVVRGAVEFLERLDASMWVMPAAFRHELHIRHADLLRLLSPEPLIPLSLPEGNVTLTDGRLLTHDGDLDASAVAGVPHLTRRWRGPKFFVVLGSVDRTHHGPLLHLSVSYPTHNPSWRDLRAVRETFYPPHVDVILHLPRWDNYVNTHPHCFHLWQAPEAWEVG